MDKFTIELKKTQLDIVMKALGELPLKESLDVFNTINNQFIQQNQAQTQKAGAGSNGPKP